MGALVAERSTTSEEAEADKPYFDHVYGTIRSCNNGGGKEISGVQSIDFNNANELKRAISLCTHVLVTIPPTDPPNDSSEDEDETFIFCDPVLNHPDFSLEKLLPTNTWVGYVSSTAVYGNHDGDWVTEASETKCESGTRAQTYLTAENEWRGAAKECGWNMHIFRCSGLYSNNRSAIHTIRNGVVEGSLAAKVGNPTSRIHEEDVTRAILSAAPLDNACLWNLADDYPSPRSEVMEFGTKLLEDANLLPAKIAESSTKLQSTAVKTQSQRASRRSTDRKRVANQKMKDLLLPELLYPSFREGLQSILDYNREKWSSESDKGSG